MDEEEISMSVENARGDADRAFLRKIAAASLDDLRLMTVPAPRWRKIAYLRAFRRFNEPLQADPHHLDEVLACSSEKAFKAFMEDRTFEEGVFFDRMTEAPLLVAPALTVDQALATLGLSAQAYVGYRDLAKVMDRETLVPWTYTSLQTPEEILRSMGKSTLLGMVYQTEIPRTLRRAMACWLRGLLADSAIHHAGVAGRALPSWMSYLLVDCARTGVREMIEVKLDAADWQAGAERLKYFESIREIK